MHAMAAVCRKFALPTFGRDVKHEDATMSLVRGSILKRVAKRAVEGSFSSPLEHFRLISPSQDSA